MTKMDVIYADEKVGNQPARSQSSAMIMAAPGSRSEGLRINVFPVTVANGIDQSGIILGSELSEIVNIALVRYLTLES